MTRIRATEHPEPRSYHIRPTDAVAKDFRPGAGECLPSGKQRDKLTEKMVNLNVVNLVARARRKALSILLPRPYESRWGSYSFVGEATGTDPNSRLIDLAIESVGRA